jgi:hypothetical protein
MTMTALETLRAIHARGDLLPWLNGKTELWHTGTIMESPNFRDPPYMYTFRPKPAPPKLRPWNEFELMSHRDDWFRRKGVGSNWLRMERLNDDCSQAMFSDIWRTPGDLCERWEVLAADGQIWLPCGVME